MIIFDFDEVESWKEGVARNVSCYLPGTSSLHGVTLLNIGNGFPILYLSPGVSLSVILNARHEETKMSTKNLFSEIINVSKFILNL